MLYKLSILSELRDYIKEHEEMSFAEIIYSFYRPLGDKTKKGKLSDLLEISDEDSYERIKKAKEIEKE